jgi:uncharacterized membrane protein HdeD (DUF308 family)
MFRVLIHNWWVLALRGVFALLFALYVFSVQSVRLISFLRAVVLTSVVELFGLFACVSGILTILAAIRGFNKDQEWWLLLLDGAGTFSAGLAVVLLPSVTILSLVRLIGIWALFVGGCELLMAHLLRRHVPDEWFLALAGAGSIIFGTYMVVILIPEVRSVFLWLGCYALFSAVAMLALAFRLRKLSSQPHLIAQHAASPRD